MSVNLTKEQCIEMYQKIKTCSAEEIEAKLGETTGRLAMKVAQSVNKEEFVEMLLSGEVPPLELSDEEAAALMGGAATTRKWVKIDWEK